MKAFVALCLLAIVAVVVLQYAPSGNAGERSRPSALVSDTTFAVMNNSSTAYRIDGVNNPSLTLYRGQMCTFSVAATGHPFYIKTARVTGTGSQYPNGVTGQGVTNGTLTFVVPVAAPDQLFYQCGVHSAMGGTLSIATPLDVAPRGGPASVWLGPARPNPARDGASFSYSLPRPGRVFFAVFDERGRRVSTLADDVQPAGDHVARWDGRDGQGHVAQSGIYFYRLRAGGQALSGRLVVAH